MKVLLVDDELIIRKGMRTFIPWENLGCTLAGEASDGMEALKVMNKTNSDIVITDIRMPGMDGLELAEMLQRDFPETKVILLTGFDDFEYARKALRFNVVEYLLKPVGEEELTKVLKKTVQSIQDEKQEHSFSRENLLRLQKDLIRKLLYSTDDGLTDIIQQLKKLKIDLDNESEYQVIFIYPVPETYRNPVSDSSYSIPFHQEEIDGLTVLIKQPPEGLKSVIPKLLSTLEQENLSAGIGTRVKGYYGIPHSHKMAQKAFSYRRFHSGPGFVHSDDIERIKRKFIESLPPPVLPEELENQIIHEFRSMKPEVENISGRLLGYCLEENLSLGEFLRFCRFLYLQAQNELRKKGIPVSGTQIDPIPNIQALDSWQDIHTRINRLFIELSISVEQYLKDEYSPITLQAIRYVENHFKDDIALKDISDFTSVSESHISRVFKKDTGINFIPWVNRFRVNYSKELLKTPALKLYDIADLSGFSDYKYYSLQFKRFVGITPGEYRKNHFSH